MVLGVLPWDYGLVFFTIGLLGSLIGQIGLNYIFKRWGRPSWIIFLLGIVIVLSTIAISILTIYQIVLDFYHQVFVGFKLPC